jgi:hypothetical protein
MLVFKLLSNYNIMSNRNEDRTLSGSTEIYCDILDLPQTINAIRIKNQYGRLEWF